MIIIFRCINHRRSDADAGASVSPDTVRVAQVYAYNHIDNNRKIYFTAAYKIYLQPREKKKK